MKIHFHVIYVHEDESVEFYREIEADFFPCWSVRIAGRKYEVAEVEFNVTENVLDVFLGEFDLPDKIYRSICDEHITNGWVADCLEEVCR